MTPRVEVEELRVHRDARGWVAEPLDPERLPGQRNVHVVVSAPGAVRGNHYHPRGTEILAVSGPALVRTRQDGNLTDTHVPADRTFRFVIPPGVSHAIKNTGSEPSVLVAFNSLALDRADPDLVPDPILD